MAAVKLLFCSIQSMPTTALIFNCTTRNLFANPTSQSPFLAAVKLFHCRPINRSFILLANKSSGDGFGTEMPTRNGENGGNGSGEGKEQDDGGERRPLLGFNFNLVDLILNPDPDNVLAVGLTGLLTWASLQVLWQLLFISLAILVAAVKYSFIAALLLFILITLL